MTDSTSIQLRDSARDQLAAQMAAYEAEHGPVQTLPIFVGERPKEIFTIHIPGKPKSMPASSQKLRQLDHKRSAMNVARKAKSDARVEVIRSMAASGATIAQMADATGIAPRSVMRLMRDNGIKRGPKMSMEA